MLFRSIYKIRRAEIIIRKPIGILVDLQGPKIRIGNVSNNQNILKKGDFFVLDNNEEVGNNKRIYLSNKKVFNSIKKGHLILIDDGNIHIKVTSVKENKIRTKVLQGGVLKSNKGIKLMEKQAKREKKLAEKKAKRLAKEGPKKNENKEKPLDISKPITLDFLTNPNKE